MGTKQHYEEIARELEHSPDYRVLRRLIPRRRFSEGAASRVGAILDLETTGLDLEQDEIIELAIIKFRFSDEDEIVEVIDEISYLNEPSKGVPEEISVLTGITQDDVIGKKIQFEKVRDFLSDVTLVIAHNASFDRPIFERYFPDQTKRNWACSATEIDWRAEGRSTAKLDFLLTCSGYFYESHRALSDCKALIELLALPLPRTKRSAFNVLVENAREPKFRIFAVGAPFETRALLKKRGYRWSDGSSMEYRAWWIDLGENRVAEEQEFLKGLVSTGDAEFPTIRMTAQSRYRG
jgi:DNA polymerase-3 subunit epsilon